MNTGQMLDRVRLLIDNDQTDAQIVGQFNELTKKLFRKLPLPDAVYRFTTTSVPYYDLPADCSEDRVRSVIIDNCEYEKLSPEIQSPSDRFCTVFAGKLYINFDSAGKDAYLYYRQRPIELSANRLTESSNLPEDYHDLYVYDAARWVAGIQRDVDMHNNFQSEYDELFRDAQRGLKKMGLRRAKETIRW